MIDISIIIINYNTNQLTIDCIKSIVNETIKYSYEIIVVDNNSTIEDAEEIKRHHPHIKLIKLPTNEGFGRANNIGIKEATGSFILLLNSDTLIIQNAIDKCIDFMHSQFAKDNNIGLMGCKLLNADLTHQPSTFGRTSKINLLINSNPILFKIFGKREKKNASFNEGNFVAAICGAFMLFKSEIIKDINLFDPDFFMYSEETEFCRNRVSKLCNIYYWEGAEIIHFGGGSSATMDHINIQAIVSFGLAAYKTSPMLFFTFIISSALNFITYLILYPYYVLMGKKEGKRKLKLYIGLFTHLFEILKYKRKWGSGRKPLKIEK